MNTWVKAKMLRTPEGLVPEVAAEYLQGKDVYLRKYRDDTWIIWTGNVFTQSLLYKTAEAKNIVLTYRKLGKPETVTPKKAWELNKSFLAMLQRI